MSVSVHVCTGWQGVPGHVTPNIVSGNTEACPRTLIFTHARTLKTLPLSLTHTCKACLRADGAPQLVTPPTSATPNAAAVTESLLWSHCNPIIKATIRTLTCTPRRGGFISSSYNGWRYSWMFFLLLFFKISPMAPVSRHKTWQRK